MELADGVAVVTLPDQRWKRCDIKSVNLLANVLARQQAAEQGVARYGSYDAEGRVTEGAGSNAYLVDTEGRVRTCPLGPEILGGVTRESFWSSRAPMASRWWSGLSPSRRPSRRARRS